MSVRNAFEILDKYKFASLPTALPILGFFNKLDEG